MNQQNQNQRQWKEHSATSNNPRWEPQKQNFDPNNPPSLQGYFKDYREQTGPNGIFMVATIATMNEDGSWGEEVDVSGGQVLDDRLKDINMGAYICIKYEGKHPSKTPGRSYNVWKIFEDEGAIPYAQLGGVAKNKQSAQSNQNNNSNTTNNGGQNFNQNQGQPRQNNQNSGQSNGPVFNNNQGQNTNQNNNQSSAPVFNTGQNQNNAGNNNVPQKPYVAPTNTGQNQNANNNGGQNFNQGQNQNANQNNGGGNNRPIFTGNNTDDNNDLPF